MDPAFVGTGGAVWTSSTSRTSTSTSKISSVSSSFVSSTTTSSVLKSTKAHVVRSKTAPAPGKMLYATRTKRTSRLIMEALSSDASAVLDPTVVTENPAEATIRKYVDARGGKRVIRKILIANNGMAATKAILSMRKWAYCELGSEKLIEFVAMATPEDLNANAEFVRLADSFVEVPGGSNRNNYANVDLIVSIAKSQAVDAVWPGWGHASENPKLPNTLKKNGIQFIGPTGPVMAVLGDKIGANILAQTAKVPSIPWSGDGLTAELTAEGTIPDEIFQKAMVRTVEEAISVANRIGYPIMTKASEGGGGKGIRMSNNEQELRSNYEQVCNEVPGSPVFMMQLCKNARHLEVQIVGDEHGNAVALNGRDCSTQRRFQKIFEEGPPTIAEPSVFKEMERAAQRLTQSIGYIGAGTVEYLYNADTKKFFFLELNPRLQVEHPVTEGLTRVNLPATQLQVAMGIPLYRIPDIRRLYGCADPYGDSKIDFFTQEYLPLKNHVIAARITAENPDEGFKPTSGRIERVRFQSSPDVWGYFSVGAQGGIHEFADSQFGHVFASGATREDARKSLVLALKELEARGEIRNPVEYLVQLLETEEFKKNTIDTSWLDRLIREKAVKVELDRDMVVLAAAVYRAQRRIKMEKQKCIEQLQRGQATFVSALNELNKFHVDITAKGFKFDFEVSRLSPEALRISLGDKWSSEVKVREQPDQSLLVTVGGTVYSVTGSEEPLGLRMIVDGSTIMLPTIFDPSELRSDVTGKVVRFLKEDGAKVNKGEPYVELEAMKMIMQLSAGESGKLVHNLAGGSIIKTGDLLARLELDDPSKTTKILPFEGKLNIRSAQDPLLMNNAAPGSLDLTAYKLSLIMDGFQGSVGSLVQKLAAPTESNVPPAEIISRMANLLQQFVQVEKCFDTKALNSAIYDLRETLKDEAKVVDMVSAHLGLPRRMEMVMSLLRQLGQFPDRFPSERLLTPVLEKALEGLASLKGQNYGDAVLSANQLLSHMRSPGFDARLDEVKQFIMSGATLAEVAKRRELSLSVDLLPSLFRDKDEKVVRSALEVYIRRAYRGHLIHCLDIQMDPVTGLPVATWEFSYDGADEKSPVRFGSLAVLGSPRDALTKMDDLLVRFASQVEKSNATKEGEPINIFLLNFDSPPVPPGSEEEKNFVSRAAGALQSRNLVLRNQCGLRTLNLLLNQAPQNPRMFSFNYCENYAEDPLRRDMRTSFPYLLELGRLSVNFDLERLPVFARNAQLWLGTEKKDEEVAVERPRTQSLFLRAISHSDLSVPGVAEKLLLILMDNLDSGFLNPKVSPASSSNIFLHVLEPITSSAIDMIDYLRSTFEGLVVKYAERLIRLRVENIEIKTRMEFVGADGTRKIKPVRFWTTPGASAGLFWRTDVYLEQLNPVTGVTETYLPIESVNSSSVDVQQAYSKSGPEQLKRRAARRVGSTYVYDFLSLFEIGLIKFWEAASGPTPKMGSLVRAKELVLNPNTGELEAMDRPIGQNDVGMVAWLVTLNTPEYPDGRDIIIVANDVTFQAGSFGVQEDDFFFQASALARKLGIPRIYISCNSGARIGLVESLKPKFKVAFKDPSNPSLGFDYLYLSEGDYLGLPEGTVNATKIEAIDVSGKSEMRYALDDIIGKIHGIGVENLRGSGLIAGETSLAYDETFTLSFVTGRSVGIGAYLVRLGQRVIQQVNGPIILTGYQALNKLLGRDVYTSLDQLGGPEIMVPNGVTHDLVNTDQEGINAILTWLSFVPKTAQSPPPVVAPTDPVSRDIEYEVPKGTYDVRHMLGGVSAPDGRMTRGFFDVGSFKEYLGGWGKSVVVGRAKLGGIPMGVIAVETRTGERRIPADPGNAESRSVTEPQAGQVWFPDSAYKTAQAIEDFNRGENLPLIIFANWRGFSGGTRDMFGEILKFGSMIVDALRTYRHPVFIYLPPNGELRGGAWVVVDPTINERMMEMYADKQSRGGILEPPGICEVKFRKPDQVKTMHRLDPQLIVMDRELEQVTDEAETAQLKASIAKRENALLPIYLQIAHEFADLHDRSGRMKAKGVIRDVLEWRRAREFFYWRVKRRLAELELRKKVEQANSSLSWDQCSKVLEGLVNSMDIWDDDKSFLEWYNNSATRIDEALKEIRQDRIKDSVSELLKELPEDERRAILSKF